MGAVYHFGHRLTLHTPLSTLVPFMSPLAIVTGGAGFIGSHLCERLIVEGYRVISLDNYFAGSKENHVAGVEYREGHTKDITQHIPETPDLVFHLGEYSRVESSFADRAQVWDLNIVGTHAVVEFCVQRGCKLVYAGSSTKFADGGLGRDQSPYAWTKAVNTELVKNYGQWFGLKYAITYFYNVFGPRERGVGSYGTLIGMFKEKHRKGEALGVVLPGTQRRNFTHVLDIVDGLLLVGQQGEGDEFGIGNPTSYSVEEVAKLFGGAIEYLPERRGNRSTSVVYGERLAALGWVAKRSLEEDIRLYLETQALIKPL